MAFCRPAKLIIRASYQNPVVAFVLAIKLAHVHLPLYPSAFISHSIASAIKLVCQTKYAAMASSTNAAHVSRLTAAT
jgi:hypothetical protein